MISLRWLVFALPLVAWGATSASLLFSQGQKAEQAGDLERAYSLYSQAAATKPTDRKYQAKVDALRPMIGLMQTAKMMVGGQGSADRDEPEADSTFLGVV